MVIIVFQVSGVDFTSSGFKAFDEYDQFVHVFVAFVLKFLGMFDGIAMLEKGFFDLI